MPRENRKRGKKHKKKPEEQYGTQQDQSEPLPEPQAGPSWIVAASNSSITAPTQEAPFGYVDAEIKAYFRTVDTQIRDWQEEGVQRADAGEEGQDPNEDRRLFFVAAVSEMSGKEKELATDPDCSSILERMAYSMDDFVQRVFMDRLSGSFQQLAKHRFASHVCQTLFTVAADTVAREARGIFPPVPEDSEKGELRTLTQLVLDACEELSPNLSSSIMDPFASHVVRALLSLLCPHLFPLDPQNKSSHVRSKKSAAYKAKQGAMKSVFTPDNPDAQAGSSKRVPPDFNETARSFVSLLKEKLDENEVRALAANQVASPVLQMLLEVEADQQMHDSPGSLMDRVLAGLITALHDDPAAVPEPSDYVGTLLRDPTSSHLLETLVSRSSESVFDVIWTSYFKGKLPRIGVHPVANFVVAKALERASETQLIDACQELEPVLPKIVKSARTGVLRAIINRAAALRKQEDAVMQIMFKAFDMTSAEDRTFVVPCILRLLPLKDYQDAVSRAEAAKVPTDDLKGDGHSRRKRDIPVYPLEPKTQGAVLLQSMLRLSAPHNQPVLDSIQSLPIDDLLAMAYNVTASRVLDAIFDSPTVPIKTKRNFVLSFIGHYHVLVDDRIGSRVGDRCWAFADPYLREKIARSVIPHEHTLAGSFYGKFFARNLNLHLLKRNPEEWKRVQAESKFASSTSQIQTATTNTETSANTKPVTAPPTSLRGAEQDDVSKEPRKRKARHEDEIDEVFGKAIGKKVKRAGLGDGGTQGKDVKSEEVPEKKRHKKDRDGKMKDDTLEDVLGAIKSAPKDSGDHKKKKRTKH